MGRQDVRDEVIHLRSAGVDLGKRFLLACVRTPSTRRAGASSLETEPFGTTRAEVRRLLAWLTERQVEVVVMEATADYWRCVYYLLQLHLNLMLVNPAHLKGIRGRKSDPGDAAFLGRAGASGLVMASFVPERGIRELCELTRRRTELVRTAGWEAQHLEKELEDTGMKLTSVLTDVTGISGRAILEALCAGERDPERLAGLTVGRARAKMPALIEALDGEFTVGDPACDLMAAWMLLTAEAREAFREAAGVDDATWARGGLGPALRAHRGALLPRRPRPSPTTTAPDHSRSLRNPRCRPALPGGPAAGIRRA
ncbi:transposase [Streptomyces sp. NBC_01589]|uniref:IS110 family transposase n=1 Tax=unclassified Streptomyces TaxID=2593676 RepID=UPI003864B1FA